jgi:hypothetical protein
VATTSLFVPLADLDTASFFFARGEPFKRPKFPGLLPIVVAE